MKVDFSLVLIALFAPICFAAQPQAAAIQQLSEQKPSSLLQPALDSVAHAGSGVDLNRWKGSNALREEIDANLASMQKDLQMTLPPLLMAADSAPESASASLPVLLNLDALYSVLLRVSIASRTGAPREENTALEQAVTLLDGARRDLGDAVLQSAQAQEKRTAGLQASLQQQQQVTSVIAAPALVPAKTKKRRTPATSATR